MVTITETWIYGHKVRSTKLLNALSGQIVNEVNIQIIGKLPAYYDIAEYLWGKNVDIDSDGNSESPEDNDWSELTLILRSDENQRIDIDQIEGNSKQLILRATTNELLSSVLKFLKQYGAIH